MKLDLRERDTRIGLGLLAVGLLALVSNLGVFGGLGNLLGMALFIGAGAVVLRAYRDDPARAWTLPVGIGLIGLGLAALDMPWSGGAFLGALGLGFLAIFLTNRRRWWALIPGGVLVSLGLTVTYEEWLRPESDVGGTIFLLGLAATFAVLYLLPSVNQRWAIWPALGLAVIAVLTIGFRGGWVLPAILIGVGAWMLTRQSRPADVTPRAPGSDGDVAVGPAAGAAPAPRRPTDTAAGAGAHDASPVEPDAAVRTTAQTPSTGAVQPSVHPETPDHAAERATRAEAERGAATDADAPTEPAATPTDRADVPPYGQEPADRDPLRETPLGDDPLRDDRPAEDRPDEAPRDEDERRG